MPNNLESTYYRVTEEILSHSPSHERSHNLSNKECTSLMHIADNENIVCKKADKGSNTVILSKEKYLQGGFRQLNDQHFYQEQKQDLTKKHKREIDFILTDMLNENEIAQSTFQYLVSGGKRTSIFYMLPKIHKAYVNNIPPGRPIVSSVGSPTEKISQLLDVILQPIVRKTRSFIEDTPDFIRKIREIDDVNTSDWLMTLDVVGLYTNIPHTNGIAAIIKILSVKRPNDSAPSNTSLIRLLNCVLKMNNFRFNTKHYLQTNGTAMGTRVAPTYANLFMSKLERDHIYKHPKCPKYWYRFIDDIWCLF